MTIGIALGVYCTSLEFQPGDIPSLVRSGPANEALQTTGSESEGSPKVMVVNGERHNFGTMDRNETLRHDFTIRNDGDAPLKLERGKTSCKCTVSKLIQDKLLPGQEATIELEWTASNSETTFEQNAEFLTNDPQRPIVYLSVYGEVTDVVRAEPGEVAVGEIAASEGGEATFKIYGYRDEPVTIEKVVWSSAGTADFFEIKHEPVPADKLPPKQPVKSGLAVTIAMKPGLPVGDINQSLKVTTNLQPKTPLEIMLMGKVVGDIRLTGQGTVPDRQLVSLPTIASAEGLKRVVYLMVKGPHRETTEIKLVSVEPQDEFHVTLGEVNRDNPRVDRYPITIEIPPGAQPVSHVSTGSFASIRLETTHPLIKEINLDVRYVVKE
jgi:hypothetical protein